VWIGGYRTGPGKDRELRRDSLGVGGSLAGQVFLDVNIAMREMRGDGRIAVGDEITLIP
jgi:hypothetical protein